MHPPFSERLPGLLEKTNEIRTQKQRQSGGLSMAGDDCKWLKPQFSLSARQQAAGQSGYLGIESESIRERDYCGLMQ